MSAGHAQETTPASRVRVASYHIGLDLPDSGAGIAGREAIRFTVRGSGPDTLRLRLTGMSVDSVSDVESGRRIAFRYDGRMLAIPVAARGAVWVVWHGTPQDGLIIRPNARGRQSVFGDNWPQRARNWIPTVDDPGDKAEVLWQVTAPAGWSVVANGRFVSRQAVAGGRARWLYWERRPIPTYTMVVGATEMTVSRHRPVISGRDTIPIEVWAYPEDSAFADSVPFRRVTEVVETLQRLIGPFPYEKLAHVESSTRYGGMENSSAIFYAEQAYVRRGMGEGVVRHETAHQWFGDAVTERDFHHLWLSEGFASYFDLVAGAAMHGDALLDNAMRNGAREIMSSRAVDRPIIDTAVTDFVQLLDENSYQKGAWVLHMLRGYVGDSAFWAGIRTYYHTYRDSSVLSADFQRVMERASGRELGWFFDQWLRQPGYPQLDVTWRWDVAAREAVIDVAQVQPAPWGLFRLPSVVLEFRDASGGVARRTVEVAGARGILRVALPARPTALRVDPDGAQLLAATVRGGSQGQ